ncbi:MAG: hypothetical protein L3J39_05240 [Verrucomicrobiales bacterium]|nr:hypothetical protein [Verrucomicrobiales bacterium]
MKPAILATCFVALLISPLGLLAADGELPKSVKVTAGRINSVSIERAGAGDQAGGACGDDGYQE